MNINAIRKSALLGVAVAATIFATGCNKKEGAESTAAAKTAAPASSENIELDTAEKQVTYIVGYNMAQQANANGLTFNKDVMALAIQDVAEEKEPRIAAEEQQQIMMSFQEEQQTKRDAEMKVKGEENLKKSQAFLDENAKKEGVITTESGLQYKVLESGEEGAAKPAEDDNVKVHYHGTLIDGTVFDSSVDRGQPVTFPVNGVIKGWVEALQLMKVGDKFELYIPADLAYGPGGTAGKIGPNDALIFQVELLEINPVEEGMGEPAEAQPEAEPEAKK